VDLVLVNFLLEKAKKKDQYKNIEFVSISIDTEKTMKNGKK
jgi:hypothetical protein